MYSANEIGPWSRIACHDRVAHRAAHARSMSARRGSGHPARIAAVSEDIRKAASVIAVRDAERRARGAGPGALRREPVPPRLRGVPGGRRRRRRRGARPGVVRLGGRGGPRGRRARAGRGGRTRAHRDGPRGGRPRRSDGRRSPRRRPPATSSRRSRTGWRPRTCPCASTRATTRWRRRPGSTPCPTASEAVARVVGGAARPARRVGGRRPQALLAHLLHGASLGRVPTPADELRARRFETREPDDDELDRLPRSVFWQD